MWSRTYDTVVAAAGTIDAQRSDRGPAAGVSALRFLAVRRQGLPGTIGVVHSWEISFGGGCYRRRRDVISRLGIARLSRRLLLASRILSTGRGGRFRHRRWRHHCYGLADAVICGAVDFMPPYRYSAASAVETLARCRSSVLVSVLQTLIRCRLVLFSGSVADSFSLYFLIWKQPHARSWRGYWVLHLLL